MVERRELEPRHAAPPGNSAFISAAATAPYVVSLDVNPSGLLSFTHNSGSATLAAASARTISFAGGASVNLTRGALSGPITFDLASGINTLSMNTTGLHTGDFHLIHRGGFNNNLIVAANRLVPGRSIQLLTGGGAATASLTLPAGYDFNLLASNFGLSAAGPTVTPEDWAALAAAVPEPGVASLFGVAASAAMLRRRRRRATRRPAITRMVSNAVVNC